VETSNIHEYLVRSLQGERLLGRFTRRLTKLIPRVSFIPIKVCRVNNALCLGIPHVVAELDRDSSHSYTLGFKVMCPILTETGMCGQFYKTVKIKFNEKPFKFYRFFICGHTGKQTWRC
jgi:hypothetical protein